MTLSQVLVIFNQRDVELSVFVTMHTIVKYLLTLSFVLVIVIEHAVKHMSSL